MKQILFLTALVFSTAFCANLYGQTAPVVSGDKDLRDTDVKRRSVEMERIERDAKKDGKSNKNKRETSKTEATKTEDKLAVKFAEIKSDFEQIQLSQDAIVKAYQTGGKIDYSLIGKSALEINKSALRLDSNLFPAPEAEKKDAEKEKKDETENKPKPAKSVRDLIVDLDNAIGSFATSPMFQNLRSVDPAVSAKAKLDLEKIIELSSSLDAEARKMETGAK
jgi:hypothetical protein